MTHAKSHLFLLCPIVRLAEFLLKEKCGSQPALLFSSKADSIICLPWFAYFLLKCLNIILLSVLWEDAGLGEPGPGASVLEQPGLAAFGLQVPVQPVPDRRP